jgi:hypothetical protein
LNLVRPSLRSRPIRLQLTVKNRAIALRIRNSIHSSLHKLPTERYNRAINHQACRIKRHQSSLHHCIKSNPARAVDDPFDTPLQMRRALPCRSDLSRHESSCRARSSCCARSRRVKHPIRSLNACHNTSQTRIDRTHCHPGRSHHAPQRAHCQPGAMLASLL